MLCVSNNIKWLQRFLSALRALWLGERTLGEMYGLNSFTRLSKSSFSSRKFFFQDSSGETPHRIFRQKISSLPDICQQLLFLRYSFLIFRSLYFWWRWFLFSSKKLIILLSSRFIFTFHNNIKPYRGRAEFKNVDKVIRVNWIEFFFVWGRHFIFLQF